MKQKVSLQLEVVNLRASLQFSMSFSTEDALNVVSLFKFADCEIHLPSTDTITMNTEIENPDFKPIKHYVVTGNPIITKNLKSHNSNAEFINDIRDMPVFSKQATPTNPSPFFQSPYKADITTQASAQSSFKPQS